MNTWQRVDLQAIDRIGWDTKIGVEALPDAFRPCLSSFDRRLPVVRVNVLFDPWREGRCRILSNSSFGDLAVSFSPM
jgi:hypothetical protein